MSPEIIGLAGIALLLVLLAVRVPIAYALAAVSLIGIAMLRDIHVALSQLGTVPYEFAANWSLSAIPMFVLMGAIAHHSGMTAGLFNAARLWLGRLPGGLAVSTSVASAGFAAASGSSVAMAAAMGRIAVPEMLKYGYQPGLSAAVVAAAGTIGSLIPPSIILIIYGWYTHTPIGLLFVAGILPGLLTAFAYVGCIVLRCYLNPALAPPIDERPGWDLKLAALRQIWPMPVLALVVIGGIYSGATSATEAGAFGAFAAVVIALLQRRLGWTEIRGALADTLQSVGTVLLIAVGAVLLTRFMAMSGLPAMLASLAIDMDLSVTGIIVLMAVLYIVLGMFLDPLGIILITLPVLLPLFSSFNMDLIWMGILVVKLIEIGLVTPPVGLNAFVVKSVVGDRIPMVTIFRGLLWFVAIDVVLFIVLALFPAISLWLPTLVSR
ncbi:TRAP transporter large permease [Alloalcanivorax mobilis]|mgnify:CR=1 FL=1|uniref:TRAP transporter large permease n=1 Tax=Alloalcanivorax mobilis TaxID=2019569 RepID=UPI000B5B274D|nr:TRAP transporter large permease [Alloalcanivorax mobilis]ASK34209.1 C4-dicarboxylate ABC transporter [Alcanivorax sp. N3-2A]|tara:strand:- start:17193 stop:18503 length:1311 start_codon:yes stop_codon:yes gene_type:complete